MEKSKNRLQYTDDLKYFIENVQLNEKLLKKLKSHPYFKSYLKPLQELKNENKCNDKKMFVLLELTRERATCAAIVHLLKDSGQEEVAKRLDRYNTSNGMMELSTEVEINVEKGATPILGRSNTYTLHKNPRGRCIIINNVEEQQSPDVYDKKGNYVFTPKGLKRESIRFQHIFTQLYFKVEVLTKLSAKQMEEQLTEISKDQSFGKDEAFVLIVISHGQNNKVLGYNACEAMRKVRFNEFKNEKDLAEAEQEMERDAIKIKDVVKVFAEDNCPLLSSKPKLFFFICCRNKDVNKSDTSKCDENFKANNMEAAEIKDPIEKDGKPVKNLDTFVSYSCAQGFESNYSSKCGMSYFGLAFTQSIVQYAGDEPLSGIMSRTSNRLKEMFDDLKKEDEKVVRAGEALDSDLTIGSFAIEVNTYAMDRQLYFNPGFFESR